MLVWGFFSVNHCTDCVCGHVSTNADETSTNHRKNYLWKKHSLSFHLNTLTLKSRNYEIIPRKKEKKLFETGVFIALS